MLLMHRRHCLTGRISYSRYISVVINCRDQVKHTEQTPENIPSAGFCQSLIGAISKRLHTSITATIGTQLAQTLAVNMFACMSEI